MSRRVLLAWEMGAGRTHIIHLASVARELMARGCECGFAALREEAVKEFAAQGITILPLENWPQRTAFAFPPAIPHSANLLDSLANFGMVVPEFLAGMIAAYDRVLTQWQPDLVLADLGFVAGLAARDRVPFVAIGSTTGTVPLVAPVPPPFFADGPLWSCQQAPFVARINAGLALAGRPPIAEPVDVVRSAAQFCLAIEETDLYRGRRSDTILPPMVPGYDPAWRGGCGTEVFVYLHDFTQGNLAMMAGMIACDEPIRLYMPDLDPEDAGLLSGLGIIVENAAVPMPKMIARSKLVVHHGGGQLAALLLSAGIPQVILAKQHDNINTGLSIEALGLARSIWHEDVTTPWLIDAIEAMGQPDVRRRALEAAPRYAAILSENPVPAIADACMELMRESGHRNDQIF